MPGYGLPMEAKNKLSYFTKQYHTFVDFIASNQPSMWYLKADGLTKNQTDKLVTLTLLALYYSRLLR